MNWASRACADSSRRCSREQLREKFGKFGAELYDRCRGIDHRPVEPNRIRKSLSNENTFSTNLTSLAECRERLPELHADLLQDLAKQGAGTRRGQACSSSCGSPISTHTTVERGGDVPTLEAYERAAGGRLDAARGTQARGAAARRGRALPDRRPKKKRRRLERRRRIN